MPFDWVTVVLVGVALVLGIWLWYLERLTVGIVRVVPSSWVTVAQVSTLGPPRTEGTAEGGDATADNHVC